MGYRIDMFYGKKASRYGIYGKCHLNIYVFAWVGM